jgi:hypothetical protein
MLKALLIFAILQLADLGTTVAVFKHGGVELNPLVQHFLILGPVLGVILVKVLALAIGLGCFIMAKYRALLMANVVFAGIVVWNLSILARLA